MTWEDPAEGMLNPDPDPDEKAWRSGDYNRYPPEVVTYRWDDEQRGCWVGCLIVTVSALIVVGVIAAFLWWVWPGHAATIDCGPDGKPALEGRACIDHTPVVITHP